MRTDTGDSILKSIRSLPQIRYTAMTSYQVVGWLRNPGEQPTQGLH